MGLNCIQQGSISDFQQTKWSRNATILGESAGKYNHQMNITHVSPQNHETVMFQESDNIPPYLIFLSQIFRIWINKNKCKHMQKDGPTT